MNIYLGKTGKDNYNMLKSTLIRNDTKTITDL